MAKYLNHIDLSNNQLQNAVVHPLGTAPANPVDGQVYYNTTDGNKSIYVYDAQISQWKSISGDITGIAEGTYINITNADGPVPTIAHADTSRTDTASADAPAFGGTFEAVTGVTTNAQGHVTGIDVSTVTIPASDNVDVDVNTTNLKARLAELTGDITISGDNIIIPGNLQVTGTTTTNNVETVSTSNGVIFEGDTADENEVTLLAQTVTADRTIVLPDASGTVALTSDIPTNANSTYAVTISDTATITHGLDTKDVIIQLYDVVTSETVYADVLRVDTVPYNTATITFASTPVNNVRVLVQKIG